MKFWKKLWLLLLFVGLGLVATLILSAPFLALSQMGFITNGCAMHAMQWLQSICLMFGAPVLWAKYQLPTHPVWGDAPDGNIWSRLGFRKMSWQALALTVILYVTAIPLMSQLAVWGYSLPYPDAWRVSFDMQLIVNHQTICLLLGDEGVLWIIENVLLMSVATAIVEETMFRGALYQLLRRTTKINIHVIAILVGLIFAIIHFESYGILARGFMGALFVYLVYLTGSLWSPIVFHALNNLTALISFRLDPTADPFKEYQDSGFDWPIVLLSIIVSGLILYVFVEKRHEITKKSSSVV